MQQTGALSTFYDGGHPGPKGEFMSRVVLASCAALALAAGVALSGQAVQASEERPASPAARSADSLSPGPREYGDDPGTFFLYYTEASTSDCGGNPACDIDFTQYFVRKSDPSGLYVTAHMAGATDASMSDNDNGGIITLIDYDGDGTTWDYRIWTSTAVYPTGEWLGSAVEKRVGDKWEKTDVEGQYLRDDRYWLLYLDYKALGIQTASLSVIAIDAADNEDQSPGNFGTPYIPIAALVAGAPGQPQNLRAKPGANSVSLSWAEPKNPGTSAVTSYTATADPSGATCTSATPSGCTITGLDASVAYYFSVTATNAQGTGPASDSVLEWPKSPYPDAPDITKKTYKTKGRVADVTLAWTKPAGATGFEIRWDLNGGPWTPWTKTKARTVTITGLKWDKFTHFEVRAVNARGPGPAATTLLYFGPK